MCVLPPRKGQVMRLTDPSLTLLRPRIAGISFTHSFLLSVCYFLLKQLPCSQIMWPHPAAFVPALQNWQSHRWCAGQNPPVVSVTHQVTLAAGWHPVLLPRVTKGWAHQRVPKSGTGGACWQETRVPTDAATNPEQPSSQHRLHIYIYIYVVIIYIYMSVSRFLSICSCS